MITRTQALSIICPALFLFPTAAFSQVDATASPSQMIVTPVDISPPVQTTTYTVKKGDSLTKIALKFNTTRKKLESLNGLTGSKVLPGQILVIGTSKHSKKTSTALAVGATPKPHHYLSAQPVQDFDVPASTFASCPVALPSETETPENTPAPTQPIHQEQAAQEPSAEIAENPALSTPEVMPVPASKAASVQNSPASRLAPKATTVYAPMAPISPVPMPAPTRPTKSGILSFFYTPPPSTPDWSARFTQVARDLGNRGISYDADWCPPGEAHSWTMDCSNTTRYLYKATAGIQLPRTASDQYYYLHLQNKAWDVPQTASGFADCNYLRRNLKPGDLLFWENTYRPERQPPITHVMVYLGTNARGNWLMAGSQTGPGGEHNRRHGGPDIYVFDPTKPCGGYTTWMGFVHHQGRFCAYGRPLEADPSKLSVAAND